MHIFFTPDLISDIYTLNEEESKHCTRVLRLSNNDLVQLIDGKGGLFTAKIIEDHPKRCAVEVIDKLQEFGKRNYNLHIAIAPTKNIERFEWFLEKVTEIGIDTITPLITEHSERKEIKPDRLVKVLISAIKQSQKAYLPELTPVQKFSTFVNSVKSNQKFIAHCYNVPKQLLKNAYKVQNDVVILIGPEGDFSEQEVELANNKGFINISLGNSRLRTETAGIVACHTIELLNLCE